MRKLLRVLSLSIIILFTTSLSYGEIKWKHYDYFKNTGGLNNGFSPADIADNEASDLQNVVFTIGGNWKTRSGYEKLNSTAVGANVICTGLSYYTKVNGSKYLVALFDNDTIQKMDYSVGGGPDGTWDDITGTLTFSITGNNLASMATAIDTLVIEDGLNTTPPYKYTGTGNCALLGGSPANATMFAFHKNMGFLAGNDSSPSTLYFSDIGDIENWSTGLSGNVSLDTDDGTVIRAIISGFDALYIWKDYSIWRLSGDDKDNFSLQRMVSGVGCRSPNSISKIGNNFMFISSDGDIYLYDGSITLKLISSKIEGTIDNANFSRFQYASTTEYDKDFYISIASIGSSTNNIILYFDSYNLAWSKFSGINANAIATVDNGLGERMIVFGDYSGYVYKYPSGTNDAGTAISSYYTTKQYRFPDITPLKDFRLLRLLANQKGDYNITAEIRKDFETTGTAELINLLGTSSTWGTAIYGADVYGGQNLIIGRIEIYGKDAANFLQVKFSNSNLDEPIEVKGWQIFLDESDRI